MEKTIQEAVAEKIKLSGENVANIVIEKLAEVEITKRVALITSAVHKQEELERDFKKINKNDIVTYVDSVPTEVMSKNRFEEIKRAKDKLEGLNKATDAALSENTTAAYNILSETLKKLDNAGGNQKSGSKDSE